MTTEAGHPDSPAWARLQEQISWYDRKSQVCQQRFKLLKILQIVTAAAIPVAVAVSAEDWLVACAGALIVVLEGLQQLEQYQQNWTTYRTTCEQLKHEQYLYLAGAGPYRGVADRDQLLAEHVEGLVSQEHASWVSSRKEADSKL